MATRFEFPGDVVVTKRMPGGEWRVAWPDPNSPGDPHRFHPLTSDQPDLGQALAFARRLSEQM